MSAPGTLYTSTWKDGKYRTGSGTSFAAPIVSALAAVSVSLNNDLTSYFTYSVGEEDRVDSLIPEDAEITNQHMAFQELLYETSARRRSEEDGEDQDIRYGWGVVDFNALSTALMTGELHFVPKNEAGEILAEAESRIYRIEAGDEEEEVWDEDAPLPTITDYRLEKDTYLLTRGEKYRYAVSAEGYETAEGVLPMDWFSRYLEQEVVLTVYTEPEPEPSEDPAPVEEPDPENHGENGDPVVPSDLDGPTDDMEDGGQEEQPEVPEPNPVWESDPTPAEDPVTTEDPVPAEEPDEETNPEPEPVPAEEPAPAPVADPEPAPSVPEVAVDPTPVRRSRSTRRSEETAYVETPEKIEEKAPEDSVMVLFAETEEEQAKRQIELAARKYKDISETIWYARSVGYVTEKGLFGGTDEGEFSPDVPMSRAMLITALYRLAGEPAVKSTPRFSDVGNDDYFAKAVAWAVENGIADGEGGRFAPHSYAPRQQMAAMFYEYARYRGYDVEKPGYLSHYDDSVEIADWARNAVAWANGVGIMTGRKATLLEPEEYSSRAETAAMLMRFCEQIVPADELSLLKAAPEPVEEQTQPVIKGWLIDRSIEK